MDAARAALERGVRALYTDHSAALAASARHPLCECVLHQPPPPDWRHLQHFPVLKRQVLREFRVVGAEMAKMPQTPRKRKKRSILPQGGDTGEYRAVCLASLCQVLAQCELMTLGEMELAQSVVNLEELDVLRRVIGGKLLPLRLRLLLLGFALQSQEKKCLESAVQSWIQEVCEKLLEEALEATASGGAVEPQQKRSRTRSGHKKAADAQKVEKCCAFCRDGASAESLRSRFGGWDFLVQCTRRTAQAMEEAGESYATNQAMIALSGFWDSLPGAGVASSVKTGRRRRRVEISVQSEDGVEPSIAVAAYERIRFVLLADSQSCGWRPKCKMDAAKKMWMSVWERELKNVGKVNQITLVDAIRHCSKADAFASILASPQRKRCVGQLLGYRVVTEVIHSLSVSTSGVITAFAQVWNDAASSCSEVFSRIAAPRGVGASSANLILRSYLSELLRCPGARNGVMSSNESTRSSQVTILELLLMLYEIFSEHFTGIQQSNDYTDYWDALLTQVSGEESIKESAQDGINWCLMLEKCAQSLRGKTSVAMCQHTYFLHAFTSYCLSVMDGAIATSGEVITSGGAIRRRLIRVESDHLVVRRVLTLMMTTFGEGWVSKLIVQLLRANASLRATDDISLRGAKNLLFPALVSFMKSNSRVDQKRLKAGQQQFIEIVHAVNSTLRDSEATSLYLVSLMRFCEAWDAYQGTHTKEPPTRANRWGFRAMIELDMLPELLEWYARDAIVHQESREALVFAAEVLQNAPNCPPTLEGSLYKVLSVVKDGTEHARTSISGPLVLDKQLVTHSSDILQRLLRAVKLADVTQTRHLMEQMKDAAGTLSELRQQLERWFSFVEMHGAAFAGRESRLELSLLCTRLIRWFPDEFDSMRYLLMTPLDSHLVFALKAFVKEAGRSSNFGERTSIVSPAASSLPSAVRVEMALHLYLSAAALPDLETLTVLLTKALVKCRSPDAYNHLTKVAQKNTRVLLPEAAVTTLRSPLRGLEFSSSSQTHQDDEDADGEQMQDYARRAKSSIYQENALRLLAVSGSVFEGGISWSTKIFDEQSAVIWAPHFFEYVLQTEFCEGALRVDLLLASLEELTRTNADLGEKALREGYWLAALLNTAVIACSSRSAGANADLDVDIHGRLQKVTRKVLQLLSISPSKSTPRISDNESTTQVEGVLGLLSMSKCAWLVIEENSGSWSHERLISTKTAGGLRVSVSGAWKSATQELQVIVMEPTAQLFLPFTHWLSGALVYSQSFLEEPSATMRRWERTFASYVTDLYLRLQFDDDPCILLEAWLSTWITSNIIRGQEDMQLLALLPSQVALFRRLGMRPYRSPSLQVQARDWTSIWTLVFVAINIAIDQHSPDNPAGLEQATELVVSTLTTLELVDLSASVDFTDLGHVQEMEPFFEELDKLLSRPQLRVCSATQVCCLLQFPLELLVCCYACKIPADSEAGSQHFLQLVKKVLDENFSATSGKLLDETKEPAVEDARKTFAVDSAEMGAFLQYWSDEMLLKYDYLDRERCSTVLEVIQSALQGCASLEPRHH